MRAYVGQAPGGGCCLLFIHPAMLIIPGTTFGPSAGAPPGLAALSSPSFFCINAQELLACFHHLLETAFGTFCPRILRIHTLWGLVTFLRLCLQNRVRSLLLRAQADVIPSSQDWMREERCRHFSLLGLLISVLTKSLHHLFLLQPGRVFPSVEGETPTHSSSALILSFRALKNKTGIKRLTSFVPFLGMMNTYN